MKGANITVPDVWAQVRVAKNVYLEKMKEKLI